MSFYTTGFTYAGLYIIGQTQRTEFVNTPLWLRAKNSMIGVTLGLVADTPSNNFYGFVNPRLGVLEHGHTDARSGGTLDEGSPNPPNTFLALQFAGRRKVSLAIDVQIDRPLGKLITDNGEYVLSLTQRDQQAFWGDTRWNEYSFTGSEDLADQGSDDSHLRFKILYADGTVYYENGVGQSSINTFVPEGLQAILYRNNIISLFTKLDFDIHKFVLNYDPRHDHGQYYPTNPTTVVNPFDDLIPSGQASFLLAGNIGVRTSAGRTLFLYGYLAGRGKANTNLNSNSIGIGWTGKAIPAWVQLIYSLEGEDYINIDVDTGTNLTGAMLETLADNGDHELHALTKTVTNGSSILENRSNIDSYRADAPALVLAVRRRIGIVRSGTYILGGNIAEQFKKWDCLHAVSPMTTGEVFPNNIVLTNSDGNQLGQDFTQKQLTSLHWPTSDTPPVLRQVETIYEYREEDNLPALLTCGRVYGELGPTVRYGISKPLSQGQEYNSVPARTAGTLTRFVEGTPLTIDPNIQAIFLVAASHHMRVHANVHTPMLQSLQLTLEGMPPQTFALTRTSVNVAGAWGPGNIDEYTYGNPATTVPERFRFAEGKKFRIILTYTSSKKTMVYIGLHQYVGQNFGGT